MFLANCAKSHRVRVDHAVAKAASVVLQVADLLPCSLLAYRVEHDSRSIQYRSVVVICCKHDLSCVSAM